VFDFAEQAIKIVHVEIIDPVEVNVPRDILSDVRLDR
jgi:hypothetical protein